MTPFSGIIQSCRPVRRCRASSIRTRAVCSFVEQFAFQNYHPKCFFIILTLFLVCIKLQYQHRAAQKHRKRGGRGEREHLRSADRTQRNGVYGTREQAEQSLAEQRGESGADKARAEKYGSGVPQVFMCRIIWQCTLTPPQPSTAAMAGMLNTPAAEAHPPVTSSVQLRSKLAQSGRRSSGIYWAAQANITIHAHIEIIFLSHRRPLLSARGRAAEWK